MRIAALILFVCSLYVLLCQCNTYADSSNSKQNIEIDREENVTRSLDDSGSKELVIEGHFVKIEDKLPVAVLEYHNREIKNIISDKSQLVFQDDVDYQIIDVKYYKAELEWMVFLIKGVFIPSEAEYDFYGVYQNPLRVLRFGYLAQPVEIVTDFEYYQVTNGSIKVYGKQWDLSGVDDGNKPPNTSLLLAYP